jgi:hypothetical protein
MFGGLNQLEFEAHEVGLCVLVCVLCPRCPFRPFQGLDIYAQAGSQACCPVHKTDRGGTGYSSHPSPSGRGLG